jgi:hypothetical protein
MDATGMMRWVADTLMFVWLAVLVGMGGLSFWSVFAMLYRQPSSTRARRRHRTAVRSLTSISRPSAR